MCGTKYSLFFGLALVRVAPVKMLPQIALSQNFGACANIENGKTYFLEHYEAKHARNRIAFFAPVYLLIVHPYAALQYEIMFKEETPFPW